MKVACVLIPHLRAFVELRRRPCLKKRPIVIVDRSGARPVVADFMPDGSGMRQGMPLEQAMSLYGGTRVLEADEPHYQEVFDGVLAALHGVSDRVEAAELGTAYVGLDGLEGMYGGEARLARALLNAVSPDLEPRVGLAYGKFPAYVAAKTSRPHRAVRVPTNVKAFLAPHPINLLPISRRLKEEMHRLGLRRMRAVASMSGHALSDRFGPEGRRAWELCNGIDHSPLVPMALEEAVVERTSLPFHTSSMEALLVAMDTLLKRAYARPDMKSRYAAAADLICTSPGWPPWGKTIRFKQPAGTWERGLLRPEKQAGVGPPNPPRRGCHPHPVRLHRRPSRAADDC